VPQESTPPVYLFGDLLALARQSWVADMSARLEARGYGEYRRSDAAVMRRLLRGPVAIGRLGEPLGITRQAARKLVDALVQRGYGSVARDPSDARKLNVTLTRLGVEYANAVVEVLAQLNHELAARVDGDQLRAADAVLRAAITGEGLQRVAQRVEPPDALGE
jgi:DNA-binding MarR family transcriptional regulator